MWKSLLALSTMFAFAQLPGVAAELYPGTHIQVRPDQPIDVAHWDRGRIYPGHVVADVVSRDGDVAIHRGARAELIVRQVSPGQFALDLESVEENGRRYVMDTTGPQYNMSENQYNQGNGLLGTIANAIAGANGEQVVPRGDHIRVPADAVLTYTLQQPMHIVSWQDQGYDRDGGHYHHDHDWYR